MLCDNDVPFITVPTTADGGGIRTDLSPMAETRKVRSHQTTGNRFADPRLTMELPHLTAATGMDALTAQSRSLSSKLPTRSRRGTAGRVSLIHQSHWRESGEAQPLRRARSGNAAGISMMVRRAFRRTGCGAFAGRIPLPR